MTLRAVASSAAHTCTMAVKFTLKAKFHGDCRDRCHFLDDIGSGLGSVKRLPDPSSGGTSEETYLEPVPPSRPHIGGCANPIDTGSGKVPTPNWGMCTKSGGRHQHNRRTQFSGCPNC